MKLKLKKLQAFGNSHHVLVAVMVVSIFAGLGSYKVFMSSAASQYTYEVGSTGKGCQLSGRKWSNNDCKPECRISGTKYIPYNSAEKRPAYCQGHVSLNIDEAKCVNELHRYYLNNLGCARKADQENQNGSFYCQPNYPNYKAEGNTDKCVANTVQEEPGGCPQGTVKDGQYCVDWQKRNECEAQHRQFDKATNKCTENCMSGWYKKDGKLPCIQLQNQNPSTNQDCPAGQIKVPNTGKCEVKKTCSNTVSTYDSVTNSCVCRPGFVANSNGGCVRQEPVCSPTSDNINNNCANQAAKLECEGKHQLFDVVTNACTDDCMIGWEKKDNELPCIQSTSGGGGGGCPTGLVRNTKNGNCEKLEQCQASGGSCLKAEDNENYEKCVEQHRKYDARTKKCTEKCLAGYTFENGNCVPHEDGDPTEFCTTNPDEKICVRIKCDELNLRYDDANNRCSDECKLGYEKSDSECVSTSDDTEDEHKALRAKCLQEFRLYDEETKQCSDECIDNYIMKDGKCVDEATDQDEMSPRLCETLGRDWVESDDPDKAAECSDDPETGCISRSSTYVSGSSDEKSYCEGGENGVNPGVSKKDCEAEHYVYIEGVGCSASCEGGYYYDDGTCEEMWEYGFYEDDNGDGDSDFGGCLYGAEPLDDGTCEEDDYYEQDKDRSDPSNVDTNINEKTCKLLGRLWEPSAVDEEGSEVRGCSVELCEDEDAILIGQDNAKPYCEGYITKIDKQICEKYHRNWISEVDGCAARPSTNAKAGAKTVKAPQCVDGFSTYVFGGDESEDQCIKPSTVDSLQGVAKSIGSFFSAIVRVNKAAICNIQPKKHWNGSQCLPDRTAEHNSGIGNELKNEVNAYVEDENEGETSYLTPTNLLSNYIQFGQIQKQIVNNL